MRTRDLLLVDGDSSALDAAVGRFERRVAELPLRLALDETSDDGARLGSLLVAWPHLAGELPHHRSGRIGPVPVDRTILPARSRLVRTCRNDRGTARLVVGEGWLGQVTQSQAGWLWIAVSAKDVEIANAVFAELAAHRLERTVDERTVDVTFSYLLPGAGVNRRTRSIDAPRWADIATGYRGSVRAAADGLVALDMREATVDGRLVLLWGPPGTGKTTLIRALAAAWRSWCSTEVVVDPDALFANPEYLFDVALDADDDGKHARRRWKLLVLEDCDELLAVYAKAASGQAMSRLLNIADGLIGQGLRLLICLSTNEDLRRLHPALLRPGRCLANVEVGRLSRAEAEAWLEAHVGDGAAARNPGTIGPDGATLAELHAMVRGSGPLGAAPASLPIGQYL